MKKNDRYTHTCFIHIFILTYSYILIKSYIHHTPYILTYSFSHVYIHIQHIVFILTYSYILVIHTIFILHYTHHTH